MWRERPGFGPSLCRCHCRRAGQKLKQAVLCVGSASLCFLHGDAARHPSTGTEGRGVLPGLVAASPLCSDLRAADIWLKLPSWHRKEAKMGFGFVCPEIGC